MDYGLPDHIIGSDSTSENHVYSLTLSTVTRDLSGVPNMNHEHEQGQRCHEP